ncbi:MAG: hypothetical protein ACPGU7_07720 [Gammaproteobacteria bacterium]
MNTALEVMLNSPSGMAAAAVIFGTIVVSAGLATWLVTKSRPQAASNEA